MLTQLTIRNYAIVETLDLDLKRGMTVISGETGAGKSIMLDALGLALGDRAEAGSVRYGAKRAEIIATFDLHNLADAKEWLAEHDLDHEHECIIRRVITKEGRSRSYINGQACPISSLKQLGEYLLAIHGQHEHQRLLKRDHHRALLDQFAQAQPHVDQVKSLYKEWHTEQKRLTELTNISEEQHAKLQLLTYQVEELDQLGLMDGEIDELEREQRELSQSEEILRQGHTALHILSEGDEENCNQLLNQALNTLAQLGDISPSLTQASEMITTAQIQIQEASQELRHYLDRTELNPERLHEVDARLSAIFDVARKHRINPEEIPAFHENLQDELGQINHSDEAIEELTQQVAKLKDAYLEKANALSQLRAEAANQLNGLVDEQLHQLGMSSATFQASLLACDKPQPFGLEEVEFLIATNKGQPARPLAKIASGGELSRISLAIQVITAQSSTTPTLIFDEVDVGIGGAIAEVVGRMLRMLGERAQILCVTHQPQVASQGHQHLFVSKKADAITTHTQINELNKEARVQEVARMLGGIDITKRSIDHAREMLTSTRH
jgi:DNA repair protein RecN (Recombination protein N)